MIRCSACGQELPNHARFCARCGARQPGAGTPPAQVPAWLLALFAVGAAITAVVGFGYTLLAIDPQLGGPMPASVDLATAMRLIVGLAAGAWLLFVLNTVAIVGLARGRAWGRWVATAACAAWMLTCVGSPLGVLVLINLWRSRPSAGRVPHG